HLSTFQKWLLDSGKSVKLTNQAVAGIRQILRCAELNGLITHAPRVESIPAKKASPKIYLTDDHLEALWRHAPTDWPVKRRGFTRLHYPPQLAWRCCLVLWTIYGFRTQELIALERKSRPLRWEN